MSRTPTFENGTENHRVKLRLGEIRRGGGKVRSSDEPYKLWHQPRALPGIFSNIFISNGLSTNLFSTCISIADQSRLFTTHGLQDKALPTYNQKNESVIRNKSTTKYN